MCGIGVDNMKTINETIVRVATTPNKGITTTEAKAILRNCGILNRDNQIKRVYKNIVFKANEVASERK